MISCISFEEILPIWSDYLWPDRTSKSKIESHSAMDCMAGYDMQNMTSTPTFFAYKIDGKVAGVNSGHMCRDNSYRSRGLWVFPEYRGKSIGKDLLIATINKGIEEGADYVWSFPRDSSWKSYSAAGFELVTAWSPGETGTNAFCKYIVKR